MLLVRDPNNKFDADAVAVYDFDDGMRLVAYVCHEDLQKLRLVWDRHAAPMLEVHVLGVAPGRHTTLQALPVIDGREVAYCDEPLPDDDALAQQNYKLMEQSLGQIPVDIKQRIYQDMNYLTNVIGCKYPHHIVSALARSIEQDTYGVAPRKQAHAVNVNGNVNQLAMGDGHNH